MPTGTVKYFSDTPEKRSYGFILPDDHSRAVFFAFNSAADVPVPKPSEGQPVEYAVDSTSKGPIAKDMKFL